MVDEINYWELISEVQDPKTGEFLLGGSRSKIPKDDRLKMIVACNMLTVDTRLWPGKASAFATSKSNKGAYHKLSETDKDVEKVIPTILQMCGQWLCGVNASVEIPSTRKRFYNALSRC